MEVAARAMTGSRPDAHPAAADPLLIAQVRRALRSLLGQRGGTMLLRAWDSGAEVRIDCEVSGASAVAAIRCAAEPCAGAIRAACDALLAECARCGCALARIECTGPARSLLPAA
jgi:hypothetical protein